MSNKERPDTSVPQAARLGKRKRGSALIQAMNEQDEALKARTTSDQHGTEPQKSSVPQSSKEVDDHQTAENNPPLFDEKVEIRTTNFHSHEEIEKRSPSSSQEEETRYTDAQYSGKINNHEESTLTRDPEEKLEKVTFYITLLQLEKLEDMVYEYKKRTRVRRANRNDIIRILIDQSSITDLFK